MIELLNARMRVLRQAAEPLVGEGLLHADLQRWVDAGITVLDGCVFSTDELRRNRHLLSGDFDDTAKEALMNKIHLDALIDTGTPGWAEYCVAQGVLLARAVFEAAALGTAQPLEAVVHVDPEGSEVWETVPSSTFRFTVRRDLGWLSDDLERYVDEAVGVLRPV